MQYVVNKGHVIRQESGDLIEAGQIVPEGLFSEKQIPGLLKYGIVREYQAEVIEKSREQEPEIPPAKEPNKPKGKWLKDPASLMGLSLEELLVQVNEIDPQFDLSQLDEASARKLLCSDFDPRFVEPAAPPAKADDIAERARAEGAKLALKAKG